MSYEVTISRQELLEAIQHDCVTFLAFYLGDELTLEVPDFHIEIWEELLDILEKVNHPDYVTATLQKLFAVPREHSKSTLAKLAVILFMRYSVLAFTLYVSKTNTVAMQALKDVVGWFESTQETQLYGKPDIIKKNESESLWVLLIWLPGGKRKRITLKAIGQGQQVRGTLIDNKRPELVIMDDIEDYDTADGGPQQRKLDEWVMGSLLKATAKRSVRIFLGNMVRSTTLLARLAKDSDWVPTVFGALVRDKGTGSLKALWEGRWSVESLLADYRKYRKIGLGYVWETEMMNLNQDSLLTKSMEVVELKDPIHPEQVTSGFICLDPAFGTKVWHDESAITVHVRCEGIGTPVLVDGRHGRWTEDQILDNMLELSYHWNLTTWAIESEAAQKLLISLFKLLLKNRLVAPELFAMIPVQSGKAAKGRRITAFRDSIIADSYGLMVGMEELQNKLANYSPDSEEHDDMCDSGAYGPIVWALSGDEIKARGTSNVVGAVMQSFGTVDAGNQGEINVCQF